MAFLTGAPLPIPTPLWFLKAVMSSITVGIATHLLQLQLPKHPKITENNIILTLNRTLKLRSKFKPISHKMRPKHRKKNPLNFF